MRILWLKTDLLHPIDRGGRIRTYHTLRGLSGDHHVTYLTLEDRTAAPDALSRAREYAAEVVQVPFLPAARNSARFFAELGLTLGSSLPYALWKYRSKAYAQRLAQLTAENGYDVLVCDFLFPAVNVPMHPPVPAVLFQHNVEAEIWRRHAEVARAPWARAYMRLQWRRMQRYEREACRRFDMVIAVSDKDQHQIRSAYGVEHVATVPTGVDIEFFRPASQAARASDDIVFVGSMDWMPNEDGVLFFAREVWPGLRRERPSATFTIVGRNPPPAVRALAEQVPGVAVTGSVSDVRPYLERAALSVVPLRVGGGTRLKIYEALAMERPVVSTRIGAEGLPLVDGEHLTLADSAEELTRACLALLQDRGRAERMGRSGADFVRARYGWDQATRQFAALCAQATTLASQRRMVHSKNSGLAGGRASA
jgi:sugar transferase (PEP-CTERM/EpsH1 system associated)